MGWIAATGLGGRAATLGASLAAHAAIAALAVGGGHPSLAAAPTAPGPAVEIAIDVTPPLEAPRENTAAPSPSEPLARAPAHGHTHPYPVPPDHDAHPHDPSLVHVPNAPALAMAPEALASEAPAPRFTLAIAPGTVAFGAVSSSAAGPAPDHDEAPLAASSVTVPAKRLDAPLGAYPEAARQAGIEGDVAVEIVVDARGAVVDARLAQPARHVGYGLDEAAVATVRRWRFSPAQKDGRVVRVRMTCDVSFRLQ